MSSINGYLFSGSPRKVSSPKQTSKKPRDPFDWSPGMTPVLSENPFEQKFAIRGNTPISYTPTKHTLSHTQKADLALVDQELKRLQQNKDGNPPKYG